MKTQQFASKAFLCAAVKMHQLLSSLIFVYIRSCRPQFKLVLKVFRSLEVLLNIPVNMININLEKKVIKMSQIFCCFTVVIL